MTFFATHWNCLTKAIPMFELKSLSAINTNLSCMGRSQTLSRVHLKPFYKTLSGGHYLAIFQQFFYHITQKDIFHLHSKTL